MALQQKVTFPNGLSAPEAYHRICRQNIDTESNYCQLLVRTYINKQASVIGSELYLPPISEEVFTFNKSDDIQGLHRFIVAQTGGHGTIKIMDKNELLVLFDGADLERCALSSFYPKIEPYKATIGNNDISVKYTPRDKNLILSCTPTGKYANLNGNTINIIGDSITIVEDVLGTEQLPSRYERYFESEVLDSTRPNSFKNAYMCLKSMPQFKDAIDILEDGQ